MGSVNNGANILVIYDLKVKLEPKLVKLLGSNWHTETVGIMEGYFALFDDTLSTDVGG
jgi:hypothetical protein